jgi:23S rRNA (cytidine2498-2'-O)-methyltransferase
MSSAPSFLYMTCQVQAEPVLKRELRRKWQGFKFAYSRPGFLTYKLPDPCPLKADSDLGSLFARSWGFSLGKASSGTSEQRLEKIWELAKEAPVPPVGIHVWERDRYSPGYRDYEPGISTRAIETAELIRNSRPTELSLLPVLPDLAVMKAGLPTVQPAEVAAAAKKTTAAGGQSFSMKKPPAKALILDVIVVEPEDWLVGYHLVRGVETTWPGGLMPAELPPHAVSRGYLKMAEGLAWSELPVVAGDTCVDLGSSPGGATQALLDRGLKVIGVDPAEMHPTVMAHPNFTHLRKRSKEVRRKLFLEVQWVVTDINLPPNYTLDTLEGILGHPGVKLKGLQFTLKLPDWKLANDIPDYLMRIRQWGFPNVRARQLQHNRQEICVAVSR